MYRPPQRKYKEQKTCVFWDLEDYPISGRLNFVTICEKIKEDLRRQEYLGEVSVHFFVGRDKIPAECSDEQIKITVLPDGVQLVRYRAMAVHIIVWALKNFSSNIIVLSKNLEESSEMHILHEKGFGVLVSDEIRWDEIGWEVPVGCPYLLFPSLLVETPTVLNRKRTLEADAGSSFV